MVRCVATFKSIISCFSKFNNFQMLSGFPANSVFIVDSKDRVRHHTVLDPRLINFYDDFVGVGGDVVNPRAGWNMEEVARLVAAYRFPQTTLTLFLSHFPGPLMDLHDALLLSL